MIYSFFHGLKKSKSVDAKIDFPDIEKVGFYYETINKENSSFIDNQTAEDLNLEAVFFCVNKTNSKIGQQFLYTLLRCPDPKFYNTLEAIENKKISNEKLYNDSLSRLNKTEDYYIIKHILNEKKDFPKWTRWIFIIQLLLLISLFLCITYRLFLMLVLVLFFFNFTLHYKTKQDFGQFIYGLSRISTLFYIANYLQKSLVTNYSKTIDKSLENTKPLIAKLWLFQTDRIQKTEIGQIFWLFIEWIKILTLVEVQRVYKVEKEFERLKPYFLDIYQNVGAIDACLSIIAYRKTLQAWCVPTFDSIEKPNRINFENLYHPLIKNCVKNNIYIANAAVFISGSNMSGKSTFLRTIGINIVLGKGIFTCLASKAALSDYNLYSSIQVNDDLEENQSLYFSELNRLKYFTQIANKPNSKNLFLIDEILKGTNRIDRCAIAEALIKYIMEQENNTLFITSHDSDLMEKIKNKMLQFHFKEEVIQCQLIFDYKLKHGITTESNAVRLLALLDFPKKILDFLNPNSQSLNPYIP